MVPVGVSEHVCRDGSYSRMTAFLSPAVVMGVNVVVLTNFILFSKDKIVFQNSSGPISLSLTLNGFVMLLPMLLLILLVVLMIFFYGSDLASKCFFGILPVFHVGLLEHRRGAGVVAGVVNGSMPRF